MALEYMVATTGVHHRYHDAVEYLEQRVARAIGEGWRPQGGVSSALDANGSLVLCQAMVRGGE